MSKWLGVLWKNMDLKGRNIAIVAKTMDHDENQWSAYLGNYTIQGTEAQTDNIVAMKEVCDYGQRLTEKEANFFFPNIKKKKYYS
jgi:hypothetical protein